MALERDPQPAESEDAGEATTESEPREEDVDERLEETFPASDPPPMQG